MSTPCESTQARRHLACPTFEPLTRDRPLLWRSLAAAPGSTASMTAPVGATTKNLLWKSRMSHEVALSAGNSPAKKPDHARAQDAATAARMPRPPGLGRSTPRLPENPVTFGGKVIQARIVERDRHCTTARS